MIERISDYPGYLIRFKPELPTKQAILFLHGFPAHRGTKGLDIADYLHRRLNQTIYLLHYEGLGESRGTFRFTQSLVETLGVVKRIVGLHQLELSAVIGHSWGGLVAVNMAHQAPDLVKRLVLLSPLCDAHPSDEMYPWMVEGVQKDWPGIFGNMTRAQVEADLACIGRENLPIHLASKLNPDLKITLIQAVQDIATPPLRAKAFCAALAVAPQYIELDMDHSFTQDRLLLMQTIENALSDRS